VLGDLHRSGLTIVVVTHDPAVASRAERMITIRDGRIASDERRLARHEVVQ
jgi:ABC-type lipoprotein export system ATPase subunit